MLHFHCLQDQQAVSRFNIITSFAAYINYDTCIGANMVPLFLLSMIVSDGSFSSNIIVFKGVTTWYVVFAIKRYDLIRTP